MKKVKIEKKNKRSFVRKPNLFKVRVYYMYRFHIYIVFKLIKSIYSYYEIYICHIVQSLNTKGQRLNG
jgi:hypothetical protein